MFGNDLGDFRWRCDAVIRGLGLENMVEADIVLMGEQLWRFHWKCGGLTSMATAQD